MQITKDKLLTHLVVGVGIFISAASNFVFNNLLMDTQTSSSANAKAAAANVAATSDADLDDDSGDDGGTAGQGDLRDAADAASETGSES